MSEEPREEENRAEKQYPVKRVCSWCEKDMGLADYMSNELGQITHGMCNDCLDKQIKEIDAGQEREVSPEFIEALGKTSFSPQDQVWILLTKAGLKPASWPDFVIRNEEDGKINKKLSEDDIQMAVSLIQESFPCEVKRKIIDIKKNSRGTFVGGHETGIKVGEEEQISFMIGSNNEKFERLSSAVQSGNERSIGLALGYAPTAVEAYCGNGELMDVTKLSEEVFFSEAFAFNPGRLSADHWQEELAYYQKWVDYVKKVSPIIYKKMMGFMSEK